MTYVESLAHHGFKKLAFLVCHGGNAPVANLISREVRSDFKVYPFVLNSGAFDHPAVKATISKGNTFVFMVEKWKLPWSWQLMKV